MSVARGLLVLKKADASLINGKYRWFFERGIKFLNWRLHNIYHLSTDDKLFLHAPTLVFRTINNPLNNGYNTDMVELVSHDNISDFTDSHRLYINSPVAFYELEFYFSDGNGTVKQLSDDFVIMIDYNKTEGIY